MSELPTGFELLETIRGLQATIKHCELRIAQTFLMIEAVEKKRMGLSVPDALEDKVIPLFIEFNNNKKSARIRAKFNEFLAQVETERRFKLRDVVQYVGGKCHQSGLWNMIYEEVRNGRLVKECYGVYRKAA